MSESQRTPHPEQPAEGQDAAEADDTGRTPHPEQPAESGEQEPGTDGGGRTPHPEQPAEGGDPTGSEGADTPS